MSTIAPSIQSPANAVLQGVTEIAKAYLAHNRISHADLPSFLRAISKELSAAIGGQQNHDSIPRGTTEFDSVKLTTVIESNATLPESSSESTNPRWAGLSRIPVIPVEESVTNEAIICLFDGVPKKMLKRYIRAKYGMEEADYKAWFGLPTDYPMVAPGYAAEKSAVAVAQGLGTSIDKTPRHLRVEKAEPVAA